MGLSRTVHRRDDGTFEVALNGSIDETADLEAVLADDLFVDVHDGLPDEVVVDLAGIERLNSIGIHRWIPRFEAFARGRRVAIEGLSYAVVMQSNCLTNLFAGAPVRSCIAPYYCAACQSGHAIRVDAEEVIRGAPPFKSCPTCATRMQFDELAGYFQCLRDN